MRRRIVALLVMAVMAVAMLAAAAPAFAQECGGASCDPNPGQSEDSRSWHVSPSEVKPGVFHQNGHAVDKAPNDLTGRGERVS
jgi:hypothetical protein